MRSKFWMTWLAIGWGLTAPLAVAAADSPGDFPTRVEVIPIHTLTLSDPEFLRGDSAAGKDTVIAGTLHVAQGNGKRPLVIFINDSGGFGSNLEFWDRFFLQRGVSTFALDTFAGRGIINTTYDQSQLGRLTAIVDFYRSLAILGRHPLVDPTRIAVMGFSRGAQDSLYANVRRFQKMWNRSGIDPALYIALYPPCITQYIDDTDVSDHPIRLFSGESDDYVQIAPCRRYVERLHRAGKDVELTGFRDAWHVFDRASLPAQPTLVPNALITHCELREGPVGVIVNLQTGKPFSYDDSCVTRNAHVAYSPSATAATAEALDTLVHSVLKGHSSSPP